MGIRTSSFHPGPETIIKSPWKVPHGPIVRDLHKPASKSKSKHESE
jgi:hypothetical protein